MKSNRYRVINGVEMCFCKLHQEWLECSNFYYRNRNSMFEYSCKPCILAKNRNNKEKREWKLGDKEMATKVLQACGYDPSSTIPVWEQFLIKHDL